MALSIEDFSDQKRSMSKLLLDAMRYLQAGRYDKLAATMSAALCVAVWLRYAEATESETAAMEKLVGEINSLDVKLPDGMVKDKLTPESSVRVPPKQSIGKQTGRESIPRAHTLHNDTFVDRVCQRGREGQCAYLRVTAGVPTCVKKTTHGLVIREKLYAASLEGDHSGQDNCSGPPGFNPKITKL